MSYDVTLSIRASSSSPDIMDGATYLDGGWVKVWDRNITSNVAPMWREAGVDLKEFHLHPASDLIGPLSEAIEKITTNDQKYIAMNPPNGWGDYAACVSFLDSLLSACRLYDLAVLEVFA